MRKVNVLGPNPAVELNYYLFMRGMYYASHTKKIILKTRYTHLQKTHGIAIQASQNNTMYRILLL